MQIIGLTGGIGSGKTAVSNLFSDLGINIIDTDIISRELITNDKSILDRIVDTFGNNILNSDNAIDRKKLANIVFTDKKKKQSLEKILHPSIRNEVNNRIHQLNRLTPSPAYIIVVIPLLVETGFYNIINQILVVMADEESRIKRVQQRDNRNLDEIRSIISLQASDKKRTDIADDIIENDSNFKDLQKQVLKLDQKYRQSQD
jgi:dephospho-CoA kinase